MQNQRIECQKENIYSNPKNSRPILLVANIPHPEAICKYNKYVVLVENTMYTDKPINSTEKNQNNIVK